MKIYDRGEKNNEIQQNPLKLKQINSFSCNFADDGPKV